MVTFYNFHTNGCYFRTIDAEISNYGISHHYNTSFYNYRILDYNPRNARFFFIVFL
jgi:spore coat protein CotF